MQLARGNVDDRPFARTVYALAAQRFTGDLVLTSEGREYRTSWEGGVVVAAKSPSPADTPGRVALKNGLVTSSTLSRVVQAMAGAGDRDPIEVIAEVARLNPQQQNQLRRRVLARSAARLFALPAADFMVDNARTMKAAPDVPGLDVRWLIHFGLRTHYSLERLEQEMAPVGRRVLGLSPKASDNIPYFGFDEAERAAIARLAERPMSLEDFVRSAGELDRSVAISAVYCLTACDCVRLGAESAVAAPPASGPRAGSPAGKAPASAGRPGRTRRPTTRSRLASQAPPRAKRPSEEHSQTRVKRTTESPLARGSLQGVGFVKPGRAESGRVRRPSQNASPAAEEIERIVLEKSELLDKDVDHYSLLGVGKSDSPEAVRKAYFHLAKKLHPDRLRAVGVTGMDQEVQRLFAAINKAFAVLSDPRKAHEYQKVMAAGGERAYRKAQQEAEEMASKILAAEEHYHLGEMALRRDQYKTARDEFAKAVELSPSEGEYLALWAWSAYCAAADKSSVEDEVKKKMSSALLKAPKSVNTHLYHGKLMKLLERSDEAAEAFRRVLQLSPGHHEAELEVRLLSKRKRGESKKDSKPGGLFGRRKR